MISTVSLLNKLLPMPMKQRRHVLCFTILYLSTTEFPTRFSFFLNKHLNCLWFNYPNFERYLFPAESSLTLDLWNKAIFLSYLIYPLMSCIPFVKKAKLVWAEQFIRLPCLVVNVKFHLSFWEWVEQHKKIALALPKRWRIIQTDFIDKPYANLITAGYGLACIN